ncbi:MAG TPA: helix-turn-helix domain-containing protein [Actinomycetales bacterium]|nr:helix-turn-helix domain-containing protein [Actinomycetales bacterium]
MPGYGQFCPVAKAMEVLDERWTMLVVRELLSGSSHFNELRRGVPKMSPALLSKRLRSLTRVGIVERDDSENRVSYRLTQRGEELGEVVEALGAWGIRWIGDLGDADLDPHLLLWDMRRRMNLAAMPRGRTVVGIEFDDVAADVSRWWLVADEDVAICDDDPGFPVAVTLRTSLRTLTSLWRGDQSWDQALRTGSVTLLGPTDVRRQLPSWLGCSAFAPVPRPVGTVHQT